MSFADDSVLPMRVGSAEAIVVELYDAKTDVAINLTGFTDLAASAVSEGGVVVNFPVVTVVSAAAGTVKMAGYSASAFTPGLWDLTIRAKNPIGEPVAYPKEGGLLQIEVFE